MPQALPAIAASLSVIQGIRSLATPTPKPPPILSMGQATQQAEDVLNPFFGEQMRNALRMVDQRNIQRGFFGQLPGAALTRSTAADVQTRRAQAIGQLAAQLQGQSADQAAQMAALALQRQQAGLSGLSGMMSNMDQIANIFPNYWQRWFLEGRPLVTGTQGLGDARQLLSQGFGGSPMTLMPQTLANASRILSQGFAPSNQTPTPRFSTMGSFLRRN